jgi:hypothetical protein
MTKVLAQVALDPSLVRVLRVGRATENNGIQLLEFLISLRELGDLGGANKGEVEWIEKEYDPLSLVVRQ